MSQGNVDILMSLWASTTRDGQAPFQDHRDMLATIDAIEGGDSRWQSFTASYSGTKPPQKIPDWMLKDYTVFFRDPLTAVRSIISNPDFNGQFDYAPYTEFEDEERRWSDLMSGKWAWKQAVRFCIFGFHPVSSVSARVVSSRPRCRFPPALSVSPTMLFANSGLRISSAKTPTHMDQ
jgi:hypothetical protein